MAALAGAVLALGAALAVAVQGLGIRLGTRDGGTATALAVVIVVNIFVLLPLAGVLDYGAYALSPVSLAAFAGAGLVGTLLGRAFSYLGIKRIGATRAEPVKASQPLHAAVLAVLLLDERLTALRLGGILLIFAGVALISWESGNGERVGVGDTPVHATFYPFLAAFLFGLEPIFAKIAFAAGTPVLTGLSIKTLAATVGLVGFFVATDTVPTRRQVFGENFRWYLMAGAANTAFLLAFYYALEIAPVVLVVPLIQLSPLFVIGISLVLLQRLERVNAKLVVGALIVVAGAIAVSIANT